MSAEKDKRILDAAEAEVTAEYKRIEQRHAGRLIDFATKIDKQLDGANRQTPENPLSEKSAIPKTDRIAGLIADESWKKEFRRNLELIRPVDLSAHPKAGNPIRILGTELGVVTPEKAPTAIDPLLLGEPAVSQEVFIQEVTATAQAVPVRVLQSV